jgi:hypothetical protein
VLKILQMRWFRFLGVMPINVDRHFKRLDHTPGRNGTAAVDRTERGSHSAPYGVGAVAGWEGCEGVEG